MTRRALAALIVLAGVLAPLLPALPAGAATTPGARALDWAEAHATGCWYHYGGAGPCSRGWDCSGLVMNSVQAADHISVPHNTVAMVRSGRLHRTWHPVRGDIAVWGNPVAPYHMEFVTAWRGVTFGAHHTGLRIGWRPYGPGYMPSAFYEVR